MGRTAADAAESFEWLDVVDANEHKEVVEDWEANDAVEVVTTTDIRLEGRPKINTESNK